MQAQFIFIKKEEIIVRLIEVGGINANTASSHERPATCNSLDLSWRLKVRVAFVVLLFIGPAVLLVLLVFTPVFAHRPPNHMAMDYVRSKLDDP